MGQPKVEAGGFEHPSNVCVRRDMHSVDRGR